MHPLSEKLAVYCENHLSLDQQISYHYGSLSVCIIDCVYSLRAKYMATTLPVVQRYADRYLGGDRNATGETVSELIDHIDDCGGPRCFADNVLKNHQKSGRALTPKEDIVYQLARYLKLLRVETIEDFQKYESPELLEVVIRAVKGISDAGVNYLFMLAGDSNRVKPDVHIHHCIRDACGTDVTNEDCQILFQEAVSLLKEKYENLTVAALDNIVWRYYANV